MYKFDFEKDNPRLQSAIGDNALFQISSMWASHGETSRAILRNVEGLSECLLMMDEPDMALSIRSCHMLVRLFRDLSERGSQIIASIHNETVLRQFKDVYSLEHGEWMTSERFIKSQTWGSEFVSVRDRSEKTKKSGFSAPSRQKSDEKSNAQIIQEM
jgi:predicted ATPase